MIDTEKRKESLNLNLNEQINNMKNNLQKTETINNSKKYEPSTFVELIAEGLAKKFGTMHIEENLDELEDLRDLDDDDFYFEEDANEWD